MNAPFDVSDIVLRTDRLELRPWKEIDLDDFYEYAKVDGVGQMAGWLPHESRDKSRAILSGFIAEKKVFAIEMGGKVIGSLGVEKYNERELPEFDHLRGRELGFVLSKDYWGRGIMTEAVRAVVRHLFEAEGLDFLICCHYVDNPQSARVQQKCGFVPYKQIKSETRYGLVKDTVLNVLVNK